MSRDLEAADRHIERLDREIERLEAANAKLAHDLRKSEAYAEKLDEKWADAVAEADVAERRAESWQWSYRKLRRSSLDEQARLNERLRAIRDDDLEEKYAQATLDLGRLREDLGAMDNAHHRAVQDMIVLLARASKERGSPQEKLAAIRDAQDETMKNAGLRWDLRRAIDQSDAINAVIAQLDGLAD